MRIFIAVDGSEGGWEALYQASRLVSPDRDKIALYYAPPQITFRRGAAPAQEVIERMRATLAEAVLSEAAARLPHVLQRNVERLVGKDHPREHLVAAAEDWQADLIAVGARGTGPMKGLVLGSVARSIVRSTSRPVLVARKKPDKRSDPTYRVLLAVDDTHPTNLPLDRLASIAWPRHTSGRVIHVVEPLFGAEVPAWLEEKCRPARDEALAQAWIKEYEAEKRHKFEELSAFCRQLPPEFAKNPPILLEGYPAEKIVETAHADDVDLIVVGTRGLGAWQRFMLGSTAEKVLLHAPCSVLVLHRVQTTPQTSSP
jgi:nucleotide-binding universal stress UspA family protein